MTADQTSSTPQSPQPAGLSGLMILPAIFVFLSPLYIGWRAIRNARTAAAILGDDTSFGIAMAVLAEFVVTIAMLAASLWLVYLLLSRHKRFPGDFITFLIGGIVMALVGLATTAAVLGSEVESAMLPLEISDFGGLIGSLTAAGFGIPYALRSQRMRNTFKR